MRKFFEDPRNPFAVILLFYAALGCSVLGFNRNPIQILITIGFGCALEIFFAWIFHKPTRLVPKSALITGTSLGLLLNYGHSYQLLFFPVFCAIASKYLITWNGKHVFNPSLFGVVVALFLGDAQYAAAPAYQWGTSLGLPVFMVTGAVVLFLLKVKRVPLVLAFLGFYVIATLARAWVTRFHLPPETLLVGTFSSPALYLFTFFMITDPRTSPDGTVKQIGWAFFIVAIDLWLHFNRSLSTLFISLFLLSALRWVYLHLRTCLASFRSGQIYQQYAFRWLICSALLFGGKWVGAKIHQTSHPDPGFVFQKVDIPLPGELSNLLEEVDPRIVHISKWLFSVGDAVAVGDYDNDGLQDFFLTNPLKRPEDRNALYRNEGNLQFERVAISDLDDISQHPEKYGISSGALFVDLDNDNDKDLFLNTAYGPCRILINEAGSFQLSENPGFPEWSISLAATTLDVENDGDLDFYICEAMSPHLLGYPEGKRPRFNAFELPQPAYDGDNRMFRFMHEGWHNAQNGGPNALFRNHGGKFVKEEQATTNISLAVATADFNRDGFTDLYIANDFGPDELLVNREGKNWEKITGKTFGSIGKDTYKGMNVSIGHLDNTMESTSVYVSNVHVPLQAEGSLLWKIDTSLKARDVAHSSGALNESAFGWGAAIGDLNRDGWLDIVQANGMVDDTPDKIFDETRDYWYEASQIMLSGPEVHGYANRWADIRGYDIFGKQRNKVYLSTGKGRFSRVKDDAGLIREGNTRGMALADFDNDGDLDLLVTHQFEAAELFENNSRNANCWIGLDIVGDGKNVTSEAIGAVVSLNGEQFREVRIANGFSAQGDKRLFFGLGNSDKLTAKATVTWPDGKISHHPDLKIGQYHRLLYSR